MLPFSGWKEQRQWFLAGLNHIRSSRLKVHEFPLSNSNSIRFLESALTDCSVSNEIQEIRYRCLRMVTGIGMSFVQKLRADGTLSDLDGVPDLMNAHVRSFAWIWWKKTDVQSLDCHINNIYYVEIVFWYSNVKNRWRIEREGQRNISWDSM